MATEKVIQLPLAFECSQCGTKNGVNAPLDWFGGKVLLGRLENKVDAIAARMGLVNPDGDKYQILRNAAAGVLLAAQEGDPEKAHEAMVKLAELLE